MREGNEDWFSLIDDALSAGVRIAKTSAEFNLACEHILRLLKDANLLLGAGSYGTSVFLSITALEETAKVDVGTYRREAMQRKRSKDPLFKHHAKHILAARPTVAMGKRLQAAIGEERMHSLIALARKGGLVPMRESALYCEQLDSGLQIPEQAVSRETAREFLLFAIEVFDDALVGSTSRSMEISVVTDAIFERWAVGFVG